MKEKITDYLRAHFFFEKDNRLLMIFYLFIIVYQLVNIIYEKSGIVYIINTKTDAQLIITLITLFVTAIPAIPVILEFKKSFFKKKSVKPIFPPRLEETQQIFNGLFDFSEAKEKGIEILKRQKHCDEIKKIIEDKFNNSAENKLNCFF